MFASPSGGIRLNCQKNYATMNYSLTIKALLFSGALFFSACSEQLSAPVATGFPMNRFENTIRSYEKRDSITPPAPGFIAFGGSSSIFFWKTLEADMAPLNAVNYGFGGSTLPEVSFYLDRTLLKYKPSKIVIYCENDLFSIPGKTPQQVCDDYIRLTRSIRKKLPKTPLYFISLKPSPLRWKRWDESCAANDLIHNWINKQKKHYYIDITETMLKNGRPDPVVFIQDSLHMNAEGYRRWTQVVKNALINR